MDYRNGKIYRIVCNVSGKQYIGSTTQPLPKRLYKHKQHYREYKSGYCCPSGKRGFTRSFEVLENDNYQIILIEDCPCDSKNELERRERYFIETMECVNKVKPAPSDDDRKENVREYNRKWKKENEEYVRQRDRRYYENNKEKNQKPYNCECGSQVQMCSRLSHFKSKKHQEWEGSQSQTNEP